jgi:hypothetical protein
MTSEAVELGQQLFAEADTDWRRHLAAKPEDVGDLVGFFGHLRQKAEALTQTARRERLPRSLVKEAYRAAAEANVRATVTEWMELANREHDVFQMVLDKFVPAASHALIFPNEPPATRWDERMYALLHESFQRIAREVGLDAPDHDPPVRDPAPDEPPAHLNRRARRAWAAQHGRAA